MLGDGQHYELLHFLPVSQVANDPKGTENDTDSVDAGMQEVGEQVAVALHA